MDGQEILSLFSQGFNDVFTSLGLNPIQFKFVSEKPMQFKELISELEETPCILVGIIQGKKELLGVAISIEDFKTLHTLLSGEQVTDIQEEVLKSWKELGEALLGGVLSALAQKAGRGITQFETVEIFTSPYSFLQQFQSYSELYMFCYNVDVHGSDNFNSLWKVIVDEKLLDWFTRKGEERQSKDTKNNNWVGKKQTTNEIITQERSPIGGLSTVRNMDVILDIQVEAVAKLGSVQMPLYEILNLGPGSIINIGHLVDEPIEIYVNNKLIAKGDVVIVEEKFGVRITEVVSKKERIESLQ